MIILGFDLNRVKNDQSGVSVILEDLCENGWSVHVGGGGCEAPKGPLIAANHVSGVHKKGSNGRFMRRDFNH